MSDLNEFLVNAGRTLAQMALYSPEHPTVKGAVAEAHQLLTRILQNEKELVLSVNEKKFLVNGEPPPGVHETAVRPFVQLLTAHNLHSLAFLPGITLAEMIPFFRMAAGGELKRSGVDAATFLSSQKAEHIKINTARYAKISEEETIRRADEVTGAGTSEAADFDGLSLNDLLRKLVERSVKDPTDRAQVLERATSLIRQEIDTAIEKVVTEFKREKTRITNERERVEGVIGGMADGVVVVDEAGKVLMMNPAAESIYGVKLGESLGKPLWEGVREQQMVSLAKDMTVPTDRPLIKEVQILGSQEATRVLRASAATVQDTNGRIVGMVSVLSDVTKQKELNRMQNEFIANVTHDLRAPIHAVKLAVGAILEGSAGQVSGEQQKMLSMANRNVERLSRLIDDLLDFSKIESGKMDIQPQVIDLIPLLKEAASSMESWSKSRGVTIVMEEENKDELPLVYADGDRILQVVNNLISNAIKFTPAGGKIFLRANKIDDQGKQMMIVEVEDTGAGISKEDQKRIFERFVQLEQKAKTDIRGTGLGLSICRALVDLHKGRLWVESPPPAGTVGTLFAFTLPAVQRSAAPVKRAPEPGPVKPAKKRGFWSRLFGRSAGLLLAVALASGTAWARPFWGDVRRVLEPTLIQLEDGSRVRLLGITGPRRGEPAYAEADAGARYWMEGKQVQLRYGLQERDNAGEWTAYVFVDGVFVNAELVKEGLALVSILPNEKEYVPDLMDAELEARHAKRGIWKESAPEQPRRTPDVKAMGGEAPTNATPTASPSASPTTTPAAPAPADGLTPSPAPAAPVNRP